MTLLTIGDSFTAEPNATDAANGYVAWPHLVAQGLGMDVENRAVPGSGHVATGIYAPNDRHRFSRQLLTAQTTCPSLVIIFGSVNDQNVNMSELCITAWNDFQLARRLFPQAKHLWIGPQWSGPNPVPANVVSARDAVLQSVWGQVWDMWMDPIDQQWFPPTHPEWWGPDQFHPNALGQQHLCDLILPAAKQLLGL